MNTRHALATISAAIAVAFAAGCDKPGRDNAARDLSRATENAAQTLRQEAREAGQAMKEGARDAGQVVAETARATGQALDDAGLTAKVKTALLADKDVNGAAIDVDAKDGRVTLQGRVADAAQIDRAVQIASHVDGVKGVENRLTVGAS